MPVNIRDPRAAALARDLARRRGTTMTEAVIAALEAEIERDRERKPLPFGYRRSRTSWLRRADPAGGA